MLAGVNCTVTDYDYVMIDFGLIILVSVSKYVVILRLFVVVNNIRLAGTGNVLEHGAIIREHFQLTD